MSTGTQKRDIFAEIIRATADRTVHQALTRAAMAGRVGPQAEAALASPEEQEDLPQPVIDWLARLRLLYGVPFEYLVPDSRMLPTETIRFFYIDRNWTDRLVDGALSIGETSTRVSLVTLNSSAAVQHRLDREENRVRPALRDKPAPAEAAPVEGGQLSGLLLRSQVVSGWPGLEAHAFADTDRKTELWRVRMERLLPDILLCLFSGESRPAVVTLTEPPEGLHFGVQSRTDGGDTQYFAYLRGLGDKGLAPGVQLPSKATAVVHLRGDGAKKVVDVKATEASLLQGLQQAGAIDDERAKEFGSGEFAVEMVRSAGLQPFVTGTAGFGAMSLAAPETRALNFFLRGQR